MMRPIITYKAVYAASGYGPRAGTHGGRTMISQLLSRAVVTTDVRPAFGPDRLFHNLCPHCGQCMDDHANTRQGVSHEMDCPRFGLVDLGAPAPGQCQRGAYHRAGSICQTCRAKL